MKPTLLVSSLAALFVLAAAPAAQAHRCGARLGPLQGTVDAKCKPASKTTCTAGGPAKSCATLTGLFNAARECKAARVAVNNCYQPPDKGHLDAVKVVGQQVVTCQRLMQNACAAERRNNNKKK